MAGPFAFRLAAASIRRCPQQMLENPPHGARRRRRNYMWCCGGFEAEPDSGSARCGPFCPPV